MSKREKDRERLKGRLYRDDVREIGRRKEKERDLLGVVERLNGSRKRCDVKHESEEEEEGLKKDEERTEE